MVNNMINTAKNIARSRGEVANISATARRSLTDFMTNVSLDQLDDLLLADREVPGARLLRRLKRDIPISYETDKTEAIHGRPRKCSEKKCVSG